MSDKPALPLALGLWIVRWVCRHRRCGVIRLLGRGCYLFYRGFENRDFDFATNGEQWCLSRLHQAGIRCVLDVGANMGDWTRLAHHYFPDAVIHAFEIVPQNFAALQRNIGQLPRVTLNAVGLSDAAGTIPVHYSKDAHFRASAFAMPDVSGTEVVSAPVMRGDDYVRQHGLEQIDFLKIDVEGMEGVVLRGLERTLSEQRIRVIQFEYNQTNIVSGFLLRDAYKLLEPLGYSLGKLYPNYVDFRPYELGHEDFCGPNFIAIRRDDATIHRLLT